MSTKVYKKRRISINTSEFQNFIDYETGESLLSKLNSEEVEMRLAKKTDDVMIRWDNFTIINSDLTSYLMSNLSTSELGYLFVIIQDLKTNSNIIYNHNIPHTNETLQKKLGFASQSMFFKLIKKLQESDIICQTKTKVSGKIRNIYIFNPYIARKRKNIDKEIIELFNEFAIQQKLRK
jgi:hypothetical protein